MNNETNVVDELEAQCAAVGTTLGEICKEAKVDRSTPQRWKEKNPKTIEIYLSLQEALTEVARRNKKLHLLKKPVSKTR